MVKTSSKGSELFYVKTFSCCQFGFLSTSIMKLKILQGFLVNELKGPSMVGTPHLKHKDSLVGPPNSPFSS